MKLYEISQQYQEFVDAVDRGDIPDEAIIDTLDAIGGELDDAVDNIACIIKEREAEAGAIREEIRRLTERAISKEKDAKRLRTYLSATLLSCDCKRIETPRNKISFRPSIAVEIADELAFVDWAQKYGRDNLLKYEAPKPDRAEIRRALDMGAELDGVRLVERMNMQLR